MDTPEPGAEATFLERDLRPARAAGLLAGWRRWALAGALCVGAATLVGMSRWGARGATTRALLAFLYAWDRVHLLTDPRPDPFRPAMVSDPRPLSEQARQMEKDLRELFLIEGDRLLLSDTPPVSVGDVCLWQGVYAGLAALRFSLDPSAENRRLAERALEGLEILASRGRPIARAVLPARIKTEPGGRRFYSDGTWQWKEDASVDSAAGWVFGVTMALELLPSSRERAARMLHGFAKTAAQNGFLLRNSDGTPTRFPSLGGRWVGSPTGLLVALAALEGARRHAEDPELEAFRRRFLEDGQAAWAAYASGPLLWKNMTTNHNIGFLALASALLVEPEPELRRLYATGLVRLSRLTWGGGNSFWIYLARWSLLRQGPQAPEAAEPLVAAWLADKDRQLAVARIAMLEWRYPFNKTKRQTLNSAAMALEWVRWPLGPRVLRKPLPVWQRPPSDFLWQRSPYVLDDWRGYRARPGADRTAPAQRFAPVDFLIAYYLGKAIGGLEAVESAQAGAEGTPVGGR